MTFYSMGLGTILTGIFVVLKVLGYVNFGWFWVFLPLGIELAIVFLLLFVAFISVKIF